MRYPALLRAIPAALTSLLLSTHTHAAVLEIQADALKALLASEPANVLVLDVRTAPEFRGGYLRGAKNVPMAEIPKRLGELRKTGKIVVVCATGARSSAVARYLDEAGYPWVANLSGGMMGWLRQRLPVER